jgi:hypothetical protein
MRKQRDCGSCFYFIKLPHFGLCEKKDARTTSDGGHKCEKWKGIKYKRSAK